MLGPEKDRLRIFERVETIYILEVNKIFTSQLNNFPKNNFYSGESNFLLIFLKTWKKKSFSVRLKNVDVVAVKLEL